MKSLIFALVFLLSGAPFAQQKGEEDLLAAKGPVTFLDSALFDRRLAKELQAGGERVEVDVTSKVSLSSIPGRMDKWLVAVAEEGNVEFKQVETTPQRTRFLFGLLPMVFSSLKAMEEERMYRTSKNYDVVVFYKKGESGDATIEKLVFSKRKPH